MMLNFGEAVRQFYGNYTNADGRAQRSAYWWALLYQIIIGLVFAIVILMADGGQDLVKFFVDPPATDEPESLMAELGSIWAALGSSGKAASYGLIIFSLVNFVPDIMVKIRRFHDMGHTGWLVLVFFIIGLMPVISVLSAMANLIWFMLPGTNGSNRYGPDPLGHDTDMFG